jgi:hypothetical protein
VTGKYSNFWKFGSWKSKSKKELLHLLHPIDIFYASLSSEVKKSHFYKKTKRGNEPFSDNVHAHGGHDRQDRWKK